MTVAVIGAGISGLTTAYYLKQQGVDVQVFEKNNYIGGSVITEKKDGFLIDLGPNSTLETSQVLRQLIDQIGLQSQKVYASDVSNKRYVVRDGLLHALPLSPPAFIKTKLFSWKAKLQLLKEPFLPKVEVDDISLADYVRYRLGDEFLDYAINPFVAGVYAGDPEQLSAPAAFPKLYNLEQNYGSFIKGAIKGRRERKKRQEVAKDRAKMFSFLDGMQVFPQALARQLGEAIHLNCEVQEVIPQGKGFKVVLKQDSAEQERFFERVVISVPTYVQAKILKPISKERVALLADVLHPPIAVVFMGFKRDDVAHALDGFGFLLPAKEKKQILGSIFSSTIFPQRAPQGKVAFTTFVGGMRNPDNALKDDEEIKELVLKDLNDLVGLHGQPVLTRIRRWPRAIPQYTLGYKKIQALFDELEQEFAGLFFAGNFRRGISVGDSVLSAFETSEKMLKEK
ncbi:protoporphyrinogen oxidase [Caldithrix abyssi]